MKTGTKIILGGVTAGTILAGAATGLALTTALRQIRKRRQFADLRGQTVLITGGSRGLGLALAEEFGRQGCRVVICARYQDELVRARQQLESLGVETAAMPCDVSKPEDAEQLIHFATKHFGRIDILVNNAATISVGPLLSMGVEDFQESMDSIFWGAVYPTLAALPQMIDHGHARIVNITSIGGKVSVPHTIPYNCAKFAMVGFSEGLYAEMKRFGIRVLTVVPGLMRTGSHSRAAFKGKHQQEYGWFALSGTNPLLSMSVERAASQIVEATRRNCAELTLGLPARSLAKLHGVAPEVTLRAMSLVNRLLPDERGGSRHKKHGHESESAVTRSPLTALGRRAARRYNQTAEQV
ncbi:MAG TPA: SDR family NAD(P)-dependent oxidoreductase [Candidatus Angelobacter sp.]|nr:SDR family NAD(P)-dependent oxidoreductase [Candidatus Angelobacter sp.]